MFRLRDDLNVRASVGKAFNLPTMTDLYAVTLRGTTRYWGNQNLAPEKITAYEIGLDYYFAPQAYAKATLYRNDATDFIYSIRRDASNFDKVNVGKVQTKGLELEASYQLSAQLTLSASHTINDSTIKQYDQDSTLVGKQLTTVPRHQSNLRARFVLAEGWKVFTTINRVGDRFATDQNTSIYAGYTTLDLGVSKAVAKDVTARLAIMNLTDKKYEGIGYMAPGRVSTLSLNARF